MCLPRRGPHGDVPFVRGAWFGGRVWARARRRLRRTGHGVVTPTLTGVGERVHLAAPAVGMRTHIRDGLGVLEH